MSRDVYTRVFLFLLSLILVPLGTIAIIRFAKGDRFNFRERGITPTGLLVAQSYPDGAEIYLNEVLRSATNTTLNLSPGIYEVEIRKSGYTPWKKTLSIETSIVTRATAWLFPTVPSLKAITTSGAANPVLSPEATKLVFASRDGTLSRLFVLDLNESPIGLLNRDARQIASSTSFDFASAALVWSPDSRQIMASATGSALLVDINSQQTTDISDNPDITINRWKDTVNLRELQKFSNLPLQLQEIFATSAANLVWSPKENKVLYTATASAVIPDNLVPPLPGSSTQTQSRTIEPGKLYVYDLEEDRNFIFPLPPPPSPTPTPRTRTRAQTATTPIPLPQPIWFPTSHHLLHVDGNKVYLTEYDGTNQTIVYSGPMEERYAFPYPSSKQLLILTNLNPVSSQNPNLYAVTLR